MAGPRFPALTLLVLAAAAGCSREPPLDDAALLELDAPVLAAELRAGRVTAERVTRAALAQIAARDDSGPMLNAVIQINPDAIAIARTLDRRFGEDGPVGPLHGVPVLLKANIDTADALATSAGSLALASHRAPADAELVTNLRAAGAVIIGKANLSEWANFRSPRATSGWSSLGGQTKNPYALDRNPCGSSSGSAVAVAARLVPLAVGTETNGSIVCPAGANGVVGIKPTLGRVSQRGIVPIAASQDTAGPLARTVEGAALLLAAMQTAPLEAAPSVLAPPRTGVRGVRLGVVRDYVGAGTSPEAEAVFAHALERLAAAGAELVDPIDVDLPAGFGAAELEVLLHEFKAGINAYLAAEHVVPGSLDALIAYDDAHESEVMPYFGQELFRLAAARGGLDDPSYRNAVATSQTALRERLAQLFAEHDLEALVAPVNAPAWETDWTHGDRITLSSARLAAVSGYPSVAVPAGLVAGLPVAIAFIGEPFGEARLIGIAAFFERLRGPFPAPGLD